MKGVRADAGRLLAFDPFFIKHHGFDRNNPVTGNLFDQLADIIRYPVLLVSVWIFRLFLDGRNEKLSGISWL